MIIYYRSLFVHVPKTGGSWVRTLLLKHGGRKFHDSPHGLPQHHRTEIIMRRLVAFCFIRHPLDYVYSIWRHWSGDPQCRINNSNEKLFYQWDKRAYGKLYCECIVEGDINETIRRFTVHHPGFVSQLYNILSKKCRYVGKYEHLTTDLPRILYKINGSISETLLGDILFSQSVNESKGEKMKVSPELAIAFMSKEPICFFKGYGWLPEYVG